MKEKIMNFLSSITNVSGKLSYILDNRYKLLAFVLAAIFIANITGVTGWTINTVTRGTTRLTNLVWAGGGPECDPECTSPCADCKTDKAGDPYCDGDCDDPLKVCTDAGCVDADPCEDFDGCGTTLNYKDQPVNCGSCNEFPNSECSADALGAEGTCQCEPDENPCPSDAECGEVPDGCGEEVPCGTCSEPHTACIDKHCKEGHPDWPEEPPATGVNGTPPLPSLPL